MQDAAKKLLLKSSVVIMLATLASRLFGLVRQMVITYYFDPQFLDPFWSAYKIPNTLRELLAEGALSVAFVPVFTHWLVQKGDEEADRLASTVFNILFLVVALLVGLGILLSPTLMPLYVTGFGDDAARVKLAVELVQLMMPFLLLMSTGALVMGILNGRKHFAAPAFAPVFFTVGLVAVVMLFHKTLGPQALGWGVLAGGLLQLLVQLPALKGRFRYRFSFNLRHPGVREVLKLMGPAALGLGVVQINQLLAPFFASFTAGGMAALQNAIILVQMPQGVFAIAVSTALLPSLAEHASREDHESFRAGIREGLGLVLFFTIPAALFFLFLGDDMIRAIYSLGGKFDAAAERMTASALFWYSLGLVGMGGTVLANRFFYSMRDMKTPFWVALGAVALNLGGNLLFRAAGLGFEFIALANSIAVTASFGLLLWLIERRVGKLDWGPVLIETAKIVIASSVLVLVALVARWQLAELFGGGVSARLAALGAALGIGLAFFLGACRVLKVRETEFILRAILSRFGRKA